MGGLQFAQDADGNWGYKAGGADTVHPFSSGFGPFQHKEIYGTSPKGVADRISEVTFDTGITGKELYKTLFYIALTSTQRDVIGSICRPAFITHAWLPGQWLDTYDPETGILKLYGYYDACGQVSVLWM